MQALGATEHGGDGLDGGPDHVVLGLLRRQGGARRLGGEAELQAPLVGGAETIAHDGGPHPPRGPVLGHLLEQVVVGVEEEREPRGELVHFQPGVDRGLDVGYGVRKGERELLHGGRARLPYVVTAYGYGVPARQLRGAVREHVGGDPHGRLRRVNVGPSGQVLLQDVVLRSACNVLRLHTLLLGDKRIEEEEYGRGRVCGHGGGDLTYRAALDEVRQV